MLSLPLTLFTDLIPNLKSEAGYNLPPSLLLCIRRIQSLTHTSAQAHSLNESYVFYNYSQNMYFS